jgi:hypothetical protein
MNESKSLPAFTTKTLPVFIFILFSFVALAMLAAPPSFSEKTPEIPPENSSQNAAQTSSAASVKAALSDELRFVGYRHKGVARGETLPNGARDLGGGLLSDEDYGVTRFALDGKFMLWLEKIIERDADGVPDWEVLDALVFDKLKKNQKFLFSYSSPCTKNGAENLDLIVMVEENRKRKTYKILRAWLANVETERFEPVSIDPIVCGYDGE